MEATCKIVAYFVFLNMADITMCNNPRYQLCESCKRKTAKAGQMQSYGAFDAKIVKCKDGKALLDCDGYWKDIRFSDN